MRGTRRTRYVSGGYMAGPRATTTATRWNGNSRLGAFGERRCSVGGGAGGISDLDSGSFRCARTMPKVMILDTTQHSALSLPDSHLHQLRVSATSSFLTRDFQPTLLTARAYLCLPVAQRTCACHVSGALSLPNVHPLNAHPLKVT